MEIGTKSSIIEMIVVLLVIPRTLGLLSYHPLVICLLLVGYARGVGLLLGALLTKWFLAAVILVFLGGIIVIFFYATSLSVTDKIILNPSNLFAARVFGFRGLILLETETDLVRGRSPLSLVTQGYGKTGFSVIIFLILYLLSVLFIVVKISCSFKGTLIRQF